MTQQGLSDEGAAPPMPGLDALLLASLQDCPEAVLLRDDARAVSGRTFAARVQAVATEFRQCGLQTGERVLLMMDAGIEPLAALFAALRAGLEPALAPCGLGPVEIAAHARAAGAVALVGPTHCGTLPLGEGYLSAASLSDTVRLVATLGPETVDGAVDLGPAVLTGALDPTGFGAETPVILTFDHGAATPTPVAHRQAALFAAALALVDQAQINPSKPLLSMILPASLAGLVAGPFAALIGASSLAMHGPFGARAFLRSHDTEPGTHLVAPALMAPLLRDAGMNGGDGSLVLLSRFPSPSAFVPPPALGGGRHLVDLYAFGETAVLARARADGVAQAPPELADGSLPGRLGVALNRARSESRAAAAGG